MHIDWLFFLFFLLKSDFDINTRGHYIINNFKKKTIWRLWQYEWDRKIWIKWTSTKSIIETPTPTRFGAWTPHLQVGHEVDIWKTITLINGVQDIGCAINIPSDSFRVSNIFNNN